MSNRFHQKFHRNNHHSFKDNSIPDAGYDPIASSEAPFRGEFVLSGTLSAFSPTDYYSIISNNAKFLNKIETDTIYVNNTLTAHQMVVDFIDVKFYETSGYGIRGSDFGLNVPLNPSLGDTLYLSGIGLSASSWASFNGAIQSKTSMDTPVLSTDLIQSSNNVKPVTIRDVQSTNITAYDGRFVNVYATNFIGATTNNLQISITNGWKPAITTYYYPQFTDWKYSLDNNTLHSALTSGDVMLVVNVSALDYRSYGEVEGIVNGVKIAGARAGNIGTLPNANVEHAGKTGLFVDDERSFTIIAPSGASWSINTLSGYFDGSDASANIQVSITYYSQYTQQLSFANDSFIVNTLISNVVSTQNLNVSGNDYYELAYSSLLPTDKILMRR